MARANLYNKSIDFLSPSEKTMGFPDDWEEGVVEIVLHPLGSDYKEAIKGFFRLTNLNHKNVAVRSYDDGLTFLCARMNKTSIESVQNTIHCEASNLLMMTGTNCFFAGAQSLHLHLNRQNKL